jgi:hypothetical protein
VIKKRIPVVSTVTASCKVYVAVVGLIEAAMTKFKVFKIIVLQC